MMSEANQTVWGGSMNGNVKGVSFKYGAHCKHSDRPVASGTEARFVHRATKAGYQVIKKGWPDFVLIKEGRLFAVEVKQEHNGLTPAQFEIMGLLSQAGIKCLVWKPKSGFHKFHESMKPLLV